MLSGELTEDTRIRSAKMPCPMECAFTDGRCWCGKREGTDPLTDRLQLLSIAQAGGMPLPQSELSLAEWIALGRLRLRMGGPFGG